MSTLHHLLSNTVIQPHFGDASLAWYPNLTQAIKLQAIENKYTIFCLQVGNRSQIGANEFMQINWLPINERFSLCMCTAVFKFSNNNCQAMFSTPAPQQQQQQQQQQ